MPDPSRLRVQSGAKTGDPEIWISVIRTSKYLTLNIEYFVSQIKQSETKVLQLDIYVTIAEDIQNTGNSFGDTPAHGSASRYAVDATNRRGCEYNTTDLAPRIRSL